MTRFSFGSHSPFLPRSSTFRRSRLTSPPDRRAARRSSRPRPSRPRPAVPCRAVTKACGWASSGAASRSAGFWVHHMSLVALLINGESKRTRRPPHHLLLEPTRTHELDPVEQPHAVKRVVIVQVNEEHVRRAVASLDLWDGTGLLPPDLPSPSRLHGNATTVVRYEIVFLPVTHECSIVEELPIDLTEPADVLVAFEVFAVCMDPQLFPYLFL